MKTATFVFLLTICGAVLGAQSNTAPSNDVTIKMRAGSPEYCLGPFPSGLLQGAARGPEDITLRLPLKLRYENHRSETILLPAGYNWVWRMTVAGQGESTILRQGSGGSHPNAFFRITGRNPESSTTLDLVQCLSAADRDCISDSVLIPVLDRSSGLDLRGKTVQIATTRDHRSLSVEAVEKLNEERKDAATVWVGVIESETLTFRIPKEPLTRNCMIPLPK